MMHYVCTGECGGASETPGSCRADVCSMKGAPLVECRCDDDMHEGVRVSDNPSEKEK